MAIMYKSRTGPRAEYQQKQDQRVKNSLSLSGKFPALKSLTVKLDYHAADGDRMGSHLKYMVNLANAKSVFRFKCPNTECIRGDFDLSEEMAKAVAKHDTSVTGEMECKGNTINRRPCCNILHYNLSLGY